VGRRNYIGRSGFCPLSPARLHVAEDVAIAAHEDDAMADRIIRMMNQPILSSLDHGIRSWLLII
jgi:hypothetical protein